MKINLHKSYIWPFMAALCLAGCSSEEINENLRHTTAPITVRASYADSPASKSELTANDAGLAVNWKKNDMLLLTATTGSGHESTEMILNTGEGKKTGIFTGNNFTSEEKPSAYQGFYPASVAGSNPTEWKANAGYQGQVQHGYDNTGHLGHFDYLISEEIHNLSDMLKFYHAGIIFCFDITLPETENSVPQCLNLITLDAKGMPTGKGGLYRNCNGDTTHIQSLTFEGCSETQRQFKAYMICNCNIQPGQQVLLSLNMKGGKHYEHLMTAQSAITSEREDKTVSGISYVIPVTTWKEGQQEILKKSTSAHYFPGKGTFESPYLIETASNLLYFYNNNTNKKYEGEYFQLKNDITIDQTIEWKGIGSEKTPFSGNFDGNGHTIYGCLKCTTASSSDGKIGFGFFGETKNAKISNLTIACEMSSTNAGYVGGFVGKATNTCFENCHFQGSVTYSHSNNVGGIVGLACAKSKIIGCTAQGSIQNAENAEITSEQTIGGICGNCYLGTEISYCHNYLNIAIQNVRNQNYISSFGGIVAKQENSEEQENSDAMGYIHLCSNRGNITINNAKTAKCHVGGIVGSVKKIQVQDVENSGEIQFMNESCTHNFIGGISGHASEEVSLKHCINRGILTIDNKASGELFFGGVVGYLYDTPSNIHQCLNQGNLTINPGNRANNTSMGSLVGFSSRAELYDCNQSAPSVVLTKSNGETVDPGTLQYRLGNAIEGSYKRCPHSHNKLQ